MFNLYFSLLSFHIVLFLSTYKELRGFLRWWTQWCLSSSFGKCVDGFLLFFSMNSITSLYHIIQHSSYIIFLLVYIHLDTILCYSLISFSSLLTYVFTNSHTCLAIFTFFPCLYKSKASVKSGITTALLSLSFR